MNIHHTLDNKLLEKWKKLWNISNDAHSFNAPEWLLVCKDTFNIDKFIILTVEENNELIALLPLVTEGKFGITTLCSPGRKFLDKSTLLMKDNNVALFRTIMNYLGNKDSFYLQEMSADLVDMLPLSMLKNGISINPYLPLRPDPFQFMSGKNRHKLFKTINTCTKYLKFKSFTGSLEALQIAVEIDKRSSKRQAGKAVFEKAEDHTFYSQLIKKFKQNFVIDILFYNSFPIAFSFGLLYGKTYHALNTAYDIEYGKIMPGKLLLYYIIQHLKEKNMEIFNFSRGQSQLKKSFTNLQETQYDIFYVKNTILKHWWYAAHKVHNEILDNRLLYGTYLNIKKYLYQRE